MPGSTLPPLRHLSAEDVLRLMPPVAERLALAERTMRALVADAELPPKIGVHPRPTASFGHAMPAYLRGTAADGSADLLGMKWVVGFPANRAAGLPAIHGTVLLSDARTGLPRASLDAGPVTAHRTAAVSGVAIARWAPRVTGRPLRVAIVGAGVLGESHLPVLAHCVPGATLAIASRTEVSATRLAAAARALGVFGAVRVAADARAAVADADLVLTLVAFGPDRQALPDAAFAPGATIVAADYDMCVPAVTVRSAALFLADERGQLRANRDAGIFRDYPDPAQTIGEALVAGTERPEGRVVVTHLGVGLADVIFGDALVRAAEAQGVGTLLPR